MAKIKKAVFPVAGLGTRLLPATKSVPKEMLPIVDTPLIQYVIDEALDAGIEHFIFVTGRNKHIIEDYFDIQFELYNSLLRNGKNKQYHSLQQKHLACGTTSFTRQQELLGLGHAVWCARYLVGNEPFALLLPDMLMQGEKGCLKEMVALYEQYPSNIVAVHECDMLHVERYGIIGYDQLACQNLKINAMHEKPTKEQAPSNLYIAGRYILQPEIFDILATQKAGAGQEIQLTDAMLTLLQQQDFYAMPFQGEVFDCGSKEGFIEANIAIALSHKDIKNDMQEILRKWLQVEKV